MTNIEQDANTEARHGNREALEAMTRRVAELEAAMIEILGINDRAWSLRDTADGMNRVADLARAALSDTPEVT